MYEAIVMGVSAGGLQAMGQILPKLPSKFKIPSIIVQHISPSSKAYLRTHFSKQCSLPVYEIEDKMKICKRGIYFAPPNYHVLVENKNTLMLSTEEKVNFSRPSIDVLFETASYVYRDKLIGIVLTGANNDGAAGLKTIRDAGGLCIVQDPLTAEVPTMPEKAIQMANPQHILPLDQIAGLLVKLQQH